MVYFYLSTTFLWRIPVNQLRIKISKRYKSPADEKKFRNSSIQIPQLDKFFDHFKVSMKKKFITMPILSLIHKNITPIKIKMFTECHSVSEKFISEDKGKLLCNSMRQYEIRVIFRLVTTWMKIFQMMIETNLRFKEDNRGNFQKKCLKKTKKNV